jgi:hypothetical protein|nr:MAG TPA: hypothetical protein [Caudoviricetes sp.]
MSLTDFERCTPDEFSQIYLYWERTHVHELWEQTRFLACCMLQPWSKKALKVTDVCRFEWDNRADHTPRHEESTRERFEELVRRTERP